MHTPVSRSRSAFTLAEVIIALTILSAVTALTLESLLSARQMQALAAAEDELNRDAAKVFETIGLDLAESGWYFPDPINPLPAATTGDRAARYFPYVHQQQLGAADEGLGTAFAFHHRPETAVRILPGRYLGRPGVLGHLRGGPADGDALFGADRAGYRRSHYARSQELIFVKQNSMGWTEDPSVRSLPTLRFPDRDSLGNPLDWSNAAGQDYTPTGIANRLRMGVLMPSAWERTGASTFQRRAYDADGDGSIGVNEGISIVSGQRVQDRPYGLAMPSARLANAAAITLANQWETMTPPDYDPAAAAPDIREYTYCVVPSPLGMGRLVCAYSVPVTPANTARAIGFEIGQRLPQSEAGPAAYLVVQKVLSDDVVRVVFDTFRTDTNLLINEVRLRLYLARVSDFSTSDQVITRTVEGILLMRARSTDAADLADTAWAGSAIALTN